MFEENIRKIFEDISTGDMVILNSGSEKIASGDQNYPFVVDKNFYYYTRVNQPDVVLVLIKSAKGNVGEIFFTEVPDEKVVWIGSKMTKTETREKLGFREDQIFTKKELNLRILDNIRGLGVQRVYANDISDVDTCNKIKSKFPDVDFRDINSLTSKHREIKSEEEVKCIEKAINITGCAIELVMKNITKCTKEYEAEAYFDYFLKKNGVRRFSFPSIIASGANATTLHYEKNEGDLEEGTMLLMDVGAEYECYCGDISRTFPVNGVFSDYQKIIYNIVLDTNKEIIKEAKIGMTFKELNEITKEFMAKKCLENLVIKEKKEIDDIFMHSVSHSLGLDAHDITSENRVIKEGMVITIEPGLYIKDKKIGIRIEDDIYITSKENIVLSANIPKEIEDIESISNPKAKER